MQRGDGMLAFVVIGALAAFGFVCGVWTLCGIFLKDRGGVLTYQGPQPVEFVRRYLWLREMGLIRCQLAVADPPQDWLPWLNSQGIVVIKGEKNLESGTGDPPGCHQRRGVSEL